MPANENELEQFEAKLKAVRPARPPADFLQRLQSEAPALVSARRAQSVQPDLSPAPARIPSAEPAARPFWLPLLLRWMVPATAVLVLGLVLWQAKPPARRRPETAGSPMKADDVQIDQQLVSTFDAVAPLPSGEPVRFRCQEWLDEVVLRDSKQGVEVARRVPRVEVVPVSFETY
jgi:hypothetical protein